MNISDAINNNDIDVVKSLVPSVYGVNHMINNVDILYLAVSHGSYDVARYLLEMGAHTDVKYYADPLIHVARKDDYDMMFLLLEYGCDANEYNTDRDIPFGLTDDVDILLEINRMSYNKDYRIRLDDTGLRYKSNYLESLIKNDSDLDIQYELSQLPTYTLIDAIIQDERYLEHVNVVLSNRYVINVHVILKLFDFELSKDAIYNITYLLFNLPHIDIPLSTLKKIINLCMKNKVQLPFRYIRQILMSEEFSFTYKRLLLFNNYPELTLILESVLNRHDKTLSVIPKELLDIILSYIY